MLTALSAFAHALNVIFVTSPLFTDMVNSHWEKIRGHFTDIQSGVAEAVCCPLD